MIEWGLYGLGTGSAGLYLANYHRMLGSYFSDVFENEWPGIPLHKEPNQLENDFNQLLMDVTFLMSNGTLKNVSLLDLPAFGSTITTLKKGLKKQFLWPIQTNFALHKIDSALNVSRSKILMSYKTLFEDWGNYMKQLDRNVYDKQFTKDMENNEFFNFTGFIKKDMKTFLTAIAGNKQPQQLSLYKDVSRYGRSTPH